MIQEGQKFPDFSLETDEGRRVTRKDFAGKRWVVFIYPKADTPG